MRRATSLGMSLVATGLIVALIEDAWVGISIDYDLREK
jgi:hypothetical protein